MRGLPPAAIMLPKSENPADVAAVVSSLRDPTAVLALVESARGLAAARDIAAIPGVVRLVFGSVNFCASLGCAHAPEVLLPARLELVIIASRLAGIAAPIDGVTTRIDQPDLAHDDARHARDVGMSGKLCIHPRQDRRAFAPTEAEIDWARRVLASGNGAVSIDGAMVDEPVRIRARAILASIGEVR